MQREISQPAGKAEAAQSEVDLEEEALPLPHRQEAQEEPGLRLAKGVAMSKSWMNRIQFPQPLVLNRMPLPTRETG